jgi:hypothetical protein
VLEPFVHPGHHCEQRLQHAPDQVRRWLDSDGRVGESVETVGPIVAQATEILRKLVKRPQVARLVPAEEVDVVTLAVARDGKNDRGA